MSQDLILACLASYLLGAIPFGWILVKIVKGEDLRKIGSGNIGATNAGRALGKWAALLVYLLDFGKGFVPTELGPKWLETPVNNLWVPVLLGSCSVIGHCFSIFLKFKGGKGVATTTGVMLALDPWAVGLAGGIWVITLALSRFVAVASILLGLSLPFFVYGINPDLAFNERLPYLVFSALIALFIIWTHRSNIRRLLDGTEPRIGEKKTSA